MAHGKHQGGIGPYVVVALILAVITFVEFVIVEWPPAFMSSGWVLFSLIAMSLVKFWMVIWYFMHLKDDDRLYGGFFSSGMVIGMGTFVVLVFLFLLPRAVAPVLTPAVDAAAPAHRAELPAAVIANIESDGASRPLAERTGTPRPADRTLVVTPPPAPTDTFEVWLDDLVAGMPGEADTVTPEAEPTDALAVEPDEEPGDVIVAEAAGVPAADVPAAGVPAADEPAADVPAADEPAAPAVADPTFDRETGARLYAANCAGCHQATGIGIAGVFPPLAGHAAELLVAPGGRDYLLDVMLYGMQGAITVAGVTYDGFMPGWTHLADDQVAALINHSVAGFEGTDPPEGFDAVRADEVAARRGQGLDPAQVLELRQALGLE